VSRPLPWVRLERDFTSEPRLLEVSEAHTTTEVVAAYALTMAEAARADGTYASRASLERSLRVSAGLRAKRATSIVEAFVSVGILTEVDGILRLTDWESLRPAERHLTATQRATANVATATQTATANVETTKHNGENRENTTPPRVVVDSLGGETVVLPPRLTATSTHCSHGEPFTERVNKRGTPFVSSGHQLPSGKWCGEVPR